MDIEKLANDAFWKKKLRHAFHTQDVDKDGFISRADFDLVVQRYQEMGSSNEHTKKLKDTFNKCCDEWGLTDSSVKFTIDVILEMSYSPIPRPVVDLPTYVCFWNNNILIS